MERPSASGEKLSGSRPGSPPSGGFLIRAGHVAHFHLADLERVDPADLQSAETDVAYAGALRVCDRRDAAPPRELARDDRLLGAGVEDELLVRAVHFGAHEHLVAKQADRHRPDRSSAPPQNREARDC